MNAQNGEQCPANKLVITPSQTRSRPAPASRCTVSYTGRPGVHTDGDGSTEGWFRNDPARRRRLRHHRAGRHRGLDAAQRPSRAPSRPTTSTTRSTPGGRRSRTACCCPPCHNAARRAFPGGSTTWHWHSARPGRQLPGREQRRQLRPDLARRERRHPATTRRRPARIDAAQKQANLAIMDQQQDITDFQSQFNGPFPFTSDGVLVGIPDAGFEEEMQTMITFRAAGSTWTPSTTRTCTSGGATTSPRPTTT